jgi:hypothetical protein
MMLFAHCIEGWLVLKAFRATRPNISMSRCGKLGSCGSNTIEGRVNQMAKQIGDALKTRFQEQGWI